MIINVSNTKDIIDSKDTKLINKNNINIINTTIKTIKSDVDNKIDINFIKTTPSPISFKFKPIL
uniref:Uncharacterized protein n=1 Tax=Pithovirus LCPAC102 TaxID=2506587 RepID=A0A4D5XF80_9VIRU|nr:MAG: hypothetical protein LCPAC102_01580 [Pithovirus LCPAC102]